MFINGRKVAKVISKIAPPERAESWDNSGFQIGNADTKIDRILVCLEVSKETIQEAIRENVDLIISHHPLIFKPLSNLREDDPIGHLVMELVRNQIGLLVAHTNLDAADDGTSDFLAKKLDLTRIDLLPLGEKEDHVKLVVFVPASHVDKMKEVLELAGAGRLGNYAGCTFSSQGIGTFRPLEGASPFLGEVEHLEEVDEMRLEAIVLKRDLDQVLSKVLSNHPYEEPAYDVFPLENTLSPYSVGRTGYADGIYTIDEYAAHVKEKLGLEHVKFIEAGNRKVSKVAVVAGAGMDFLHQARADGVTCLVTGDVKYHEAREAVHQGIHIVDIGHFESENMYIPHFKNLLERYFEQEHYEAKIILSKENINPFKSV